MTNLGAHPDSARRSLPACRSGPAHPGYDDRTTARVARIVRARLARYARQLERAGYGTQPWRRHDGAPLGLFVTGRAR
jgi:hypothetical protein